MGFLSKLLPTLEGAALMAGSNAMGVPMDPATAAMIVGAANGASSGSLEKGISAGIGAYGGAGFTSGLASAGTAQATNAIGQSAAAAGDEAARQAIQSAGPQMIGADLEQMGAAEAAKANMLSPDVIGQSAREAASNAYMPSAAQSAALNSPVQTGLSSLGTEAGRSAFAQQMGGPSGMAKMGLAAAAPAISAAVPRPAPVQQDTKMPQRLVYNPGMALDAQGKPMMPPSTVPGPDDLGRDFGAERNYFPYAGYQQISQEQAKALRGYANGGTIEQMSTNNSIGANTGYPGADIGGHAYATPWQTPTPQNVVAGAQDVAVDPYTGAEQRTAPAPVAQFADGGVTGQGGLDLHIPIDLGGGSGGGGGFGGGGANGYSAAGSGSGTPNGEGLGFGGGDNGFGGLGQQMGFGGNQSDFRDRLAAMAANVFKSMQGGYGLPAGTMPQQDPDAVGGQAALAQGQNSNAPQTQSALQAAAGSTAEPQKMATGGLSAAASHLGGYSDGGRLLRGPGDGVSDSIPATIGGKRPARLADGEFVVPARIVSELGNGSTEAGARKLYAMLDRVQAARKKSIGKGKVAKNSKADKFLPA